MSKSKDNGGAQKKTQEESAPMLLGIEATAQVIPRSTQPWWIADAARLPPIPAIQAPPGGRTRHQVIMDSSCCKQFKYLLLLRAYLR